MWKMSIQYSNPRPLEHESIPIITTPIQKLLFRKNQFQVSGALVIWTAGAEWPKRTVKGSKAAGLKVEEMEQASWSMTRETGSRESGGPGSRKDPVK